MSEKRSHVYLFSYSTTVTLLDTQKSSQHYQPNKNISRPSTTPKSDTARKRLAHYLRPHRKSKGPNGTNGASSSGFKGAYLNPPAEKPSRKTRAMVTAAITEAASSRCSTTVSAGMEASGPPGPCSCGPLHDGLSPPWNKGICARRRRGAALCVLFSCRGVFWTLGCVGEIFL